MSGREDILQSIRLNRPQIERPLPAVSLFDDTPPPSLLAAFKESLVRMGGLFLEPPASGDALAPVRAKIANAKVVCSTVADIEGNRNITDVRASQELADVDFAIVRASFAVAETGSILLSEANLHVNALAYLAQHLIVLLDPADIVINLHHAYRRPEFRERRYAAFHTGPSATADIEGVLIHGAQGVRSLSVLAVRAVAPALTSTPEGQYMTLEDRQSIADLMTGWIHGDLAERDQLRELFHPDGTIEVSWFEGRASDFVDGSMRMCVPNTSLGHQSQPSTTKGSDLERTMKGRGPGLAGDLMRFGSSPFFLPVPPLTDRSM